MLIGSSGDGGKDRFQVGHVAEDTEDRIITQQKYGTSKLRAAVVRATALDMDIAERRRAHFLDWLEASDWNAKTLAEHAGVPYTTLHSYVKKAADATRSLRGDTEAQLAESLGLSVEDLFGSPTNHVRAWREAKYWTEAELADRMGVDEDYVRGLEVGDIPISPKVLARVAEAFGVQPGRLRNAPDDLGMEAAAIVADIAPEDRVRALEVLKAFKRTGTDG